MGATVWLLPTIAASTMIAQVMGCGQGQMSQWGCGNYWVVGKSPCAVDLHNAVTVSQQRLGKRVAQLGSARMDEAWGALLFSAPVISIYF
jgi:hypothetical protein